MTLRTPAILGVFLAAMPLLGVAPASPNAPDSAWAPQNGPVAGSVQSVGGNTNVLIASTFVHGTLRSFDGGHTWERTDPFPAVTKGRVAFDPGNPNVGYVAGFGGVARTLDGGQTWSHVLAVARAARIDVGPTGAILVAARFADATNHILRSDDQGASWVNLQAPLPSVVPLCGVAFGRNAGEILTMTDAQSWFSHDSGATWTPTGGAGFDFAIQDDGIVWRSSLTLLQRTTDGGQAWNNVSAPGFGTALGTHPSGGIYLATIAGLVRTTDAGATWTNLGFAAATPDAQGVFADPSEPDAAFVADLRVGIARIGPDGTGAFAYEGRSQALSPVRVLDLDATADGNTLVAATPIGLYMSRDAGARWFHAGAGLAPQGTQAAAVSADGSTVLGGGSNALNEPVVYTSRDAGLHFDKVTLSSLGNATVIRLAVDPLDPLRAAAVLRGEFLVDDVQASLNGGLAWESWLRATGFHDAAWHPATGWLLVATEAGVVARPQAGAWSPVGALAARALATRGDAVVAGTAAQTVWRSPAPALPVLGPWATLLEPATDAAIGPTGDPWVAVGDGTLWRCTDATVPPTCHQDGPPQKGIAALTVTGNRLVASTDQGLWTRPA